MRDAIDLVPLLRRLAEARTADASWRRRIPWMKDRLRELARALRAGPRGRRRRVLERRWSRAARSIRR